MKRAAVLIGVDHCKGLPVLADAAAGARRMQAWTAEQGFDPKRVEVLTDETEPVSSSRVIEAVQRLLEPGNVEQLIVYFAGHGVNLGRSEQWLLSAAPGNPNEAVDLEASAVLARTVGIPHVIFFSDACRTAAEGIRSQSLRGSLIFPNDIDSTEAPVDQFFASGLGSPALEIKDANDAAGAFKALYTEVLLEALSFQQPELLDEEDAGEQIAAYLRLSPLARYLRTAVPERFTERLPSSPVPPPRPVDRVSSLTYLPDAWLARATRKKPVTRLGETAWSPRRARVSPPEDTLAELSRQTLSALLREDHESAREHVHTAISKGIPGAGTFEVDFGGDRDDSAAEVRPRALRVRGARLAEARTRQRFLDLGDAGRWVETTNVGHGESVLLVLPDESGLLLPLLEDFNVELTFEPRELVMVTYSPAYGSRRWTENRAGMREAASLRDFIARASHQGVFQLEGEDALTIAERLRRLKGADPTLALYAAYAFHDLQRGDLVRDMRRYQRADLGWDLFDVALLARELGTRPSSSPPRVKPSFPLMAQGWALLDAFGVSLPGRLAELRQHLLPSLWSCFEPRGVALLRDALQKGEV